MVDVEPSWKVIVLPTGYVAITVGLYGIPADTGLQPVSPPLSLVGITNDGSSRVTLTLPPIEIPPPMFIGILYSWDPKPNTLAQQHRANHSHHFTDSIHGVVHTQNAGTQQHNSQLKRQ
jgi:hypothetical protein